MRLAGSARASGRVSPTDLCCAQDASDTAS